MNIEDFLPTYPGYEQDPLFSIYSDKELTQVIQNKKEFLELSLPREERPEPKSLLLHQRFVQRFMSGYTPYNGILLWHAVGTGKTGCAIAIAEGIKHFNESFQKALLLVRSNTFIRNFKNELAYEMTDGIYLPPNVESLTAGEKTRRINKRIGQYYEFNTFQVFAKEFKNADEESKERLVNYYSNRVIIIDEAHNIRRTKSGFYEAIHDFLHRVKNAKIVLLTATPMQDQAFEFADVMNLILPMDKQLPTGAIFMNTLFPNWRDDSSEEFLKNLQIDDAVKADFIEAIEGRVSYLQPIQSDVKIINVGEQLDDSPFPQVLCEMSELQSNVFLRYYKQEVEDRVQPSAIEVENEDEMPVEMAAEEKGEDEDEEDKDDKPNDGRDKGSTLYKKSIKSSLCVSERQRVTKPKQVPKAFSNKSMLSELDETKVDQSTDDILQRYSDKLKVLEKYSAKYHYIIRHVLANPKRNAFVYSIFVSNQGIATLKEVFNKFGFSEAKGEIKTIGKRYSIITGKTNETETEAILSAFNRPENANGDYIQVIIGSGAFGEGRSLLSIRDIFIATPFWNLTDMDQAIGRGIRFGSHRYLKPEDKTVSIHRLRAVAPEQNKSIDGYITKIAYTKDILSKKIESFARAAAIDCELNHERNLQYADDYSRQCLYQECDYMCAVPRDPDEKEIEDTYNLFYTEKEYQRIKTHFQLLFARKFEYLLSDVLIHRELTVYSRIVVLRSITSMIERREIFKNPLGFPNYMKEKDGLLFLVNDATIAPLPYNLYDAKLGQKYPQIRFRNFLQQYMIKNLDSIVNKIKKLLESGRDLEAEAEALKQQSQSEEYSKSKVSLQTSSKQQKSRADFIFVTAKNLFGSLTESIRLELLRYAIEHSSKNTMIINFVLEEMNGFYNDIDGEMHIPNLNEKFVDGQWVQLEPFSLEVFKTRLDASGLDYYGVSVSDKGFKLVNYKVAGSTGKRIQSFNKTELKKILDDTFAYYLTTLTQERRAQELGQKLDLKTQDKATSRLEFLLSALGLVLTEEQNKMFYKK